MAIVSRPQYLTPGALPQDASRAAQSLHRLRQAACVAEAVSRDVEGAVSRFDNHPKEEQETAAEELGIDAKALTQVSKAIVSAIAATVEDEKPKTPRLKK